MIEWIKYVVGTQDIRNLSARRIRQINAANGHPDPENIVTTHFAEPWQEGYDSQVATAWAMYGQSNFTVHIKLKTQPAGTLVQVVGLQAYDRLVAQRYVGVGEATDPSRLTGGLLQRQVPRALAAAGTPGWQTITPVVRQLSNTHPLTQGMNTIDGKDIGKNVCRLWFFGGNDAATAPLTRIRILVDGEQVYDLSRAEAVALLARYNVTLPDDIPGLVCFDLNGRTEWITANRAMIYELTAPGSQTVDRVAETISMGFAAKPRVSTHPPHHTT